jgi:hypothetical protein
MKRSTNYHIPTFYGAAALSITTIGIMTFSIITLSITTFSITIIKCDTQHIGRLLLCSVLLMFGVANKPFMLTVIILML